MPEVLEKQPDYYQVMARLSYPYISTLLLGDRYPTTAQLILAQDEMVEADFKTAKKKFVEQGAPDDQVKEYFEQFKALKPRIQDAEQRDIDQWAKQGWEKFQVFVDELKGTKSKNQIKKQEKSEGAELIAENDDWKVYRITSHAAAIRYGSNTKWCITQESDAHWKQYITNSDFYFFISKKKRDDDWNKIALQVGTDGIKNYWDETDVNHGYDALPKDLNLPEFEIPIPQPKFMLNGKMYTLDQAKKDPKLFAKYLLVTDVLEPNTPLNHLEFDNEMCSIGLYPEEMIQYVPGLRRDDRKDLEGLLEQHYDVDFSLKDHDIDDMIETLKKAHPKTYQKIQKDLVRVGEETEDEYSYRESGAWISRHEDELPSLYNAAQSALADGYSVGTADAAHKYVQGILEDFEWDHGAGITKGENGLLWLNIPMSNLTGEYEDNIGELNNYPRNRRDGFDNEFSDSVADERFYEVLSEEKYAVD